MSITGTSSETPRDFDLGETWLPPASLKSLSKPMVYLRGPIPWGWLRQAILLGGSALATALAIWHLRALNKSLTFRASLGQLRKWTGLTEKSTRASLCKLEGAGLVAVERPVGQSPVITIIELPLRHNSTTTPTSPIQKQR